VALVLRKVDFRRRLRDQLAVPHGPSGWLAARTMPLTHTVFYGPAAERLRLRPEDELLEVACGSGAFLAEHARHVKRIAGIDLSDIQVRLARRRLRERIARGSAEIVLGNAVSLPWSDDRFTAVACLGSLEFFVDPDAAVREMKRVLKPGGRMVVTFGVDESDKKTVQEMDRWGIPHPSEADARKVIEDAGFSLVTISYLGGEYRARYLQGVKPE
jgi:SAM-dependent methyltransferase